MSSDQIGGDMTKNSIVEKFKFFEAIFEGLFTNRFLDCHIISNKVLDPWNINLAKNSKLNDTVPTRLALLGDHIKITKNGAKWRKIPKFWIL